MEQARHFFENVLADFTTLPPAGSSLPSSPQATTLALVLTGVVGLIAMLLLICVLGKVVGWLSWMGAKFRAMIEVWLYLVLFIGTTYVLSVYWGSTHHMLRDFHLVIRRLLAVGIGHGHQVWAWGKNFAWNKLPLFNQNQ